MAGDARGLSSGWPLFRSFRAADLPRDLVAGLTLAAIAIPEQMATARLGGLSQVEGRPAVLPEITGTAYLTGFSQQLFDPDDPMRGGYLLDV